MTGRLVLATANPGKVAELSRLLVGLPYEVRSLAEYPGLALPPEVGATYADNARAKARAVHAATGALAIGDDSGLEVAALAGGPGVETARYGGPGLDDAERMARLLAAVRGACSRAARFRCVLTLVAPWGEHAVVEGVADGWLADAPRGRGGFGYDPIFVVPEIGRTFAELEEAERHRWSHRARAVARAAPLLLDWARRAAAPSHDPRG
ncbi:MAG: non-canonical purine NTP pyrophosphatase [Candidatus Rokuibacteriota bacterium]